MSIVFIVIQFAGDTKYENRHIFLDLSIEDEEEVANYFFLGEVFETGNGK